jgi:arylformamidase
MKSDAQDWRVQFDAEVTFTNGGDLQAHGFRLDIPGRDISDTAVGELFTRHLGLLMVDRVRISNRVLLQEAHKGSRGLTEDGPTGAPREPLELSHVIRHGMLTYPGLPAPEIVLRQELAPFRVPQKRGSLSGSHAVGEHHGRERASEVGGGGYRS